jgi:hypothetical protein
MIAQIALLIVLGLLTSCCALVNEHENCDFWAANGECEANPGYMLSHCAKACSTVMGDITPKNNDIPSSFYDIVEKDINGDDVHFSIFKGKVVYLVNVASHW